LAGETSVNVQISEARELEFPAVTVCNANPIKKSALEAAAGDDPILQQLLDLGTQGGNSNKKKKRRKRAGSNIVFLVMFWSTNKYSYNA
jgi:hypothetical protein